MGKKTFPDCCAAAKQLDDNIGGVIVATILSDERGVLREHKRSTLREEWHFKLCPYCGKKVK
jgi:hypothetical protein